MASHFVALYHHCALFQWITQVSNLGKSKREGGLKPQSPKNRGKYSEITFITFHNYSVIIPLV